MSRFTGASMGGFETSATRRKRDARARARQDAAWAARSGPVVITPIPDPESLTCPHCDEEGPYEFAIVTWPELLDHAAAAGVRVREDMRTLPGTMTLPDGASYWWCHSCCNGGSFLNA
jgi:hypothetical protein